MTAEDYSSHSKFADWLMGDRATGPLLRERGNLAAVTAFWIVIGLVSWVVEFAISYVDPEGPISLARAATRWVYAVLGWIASLVGIWLADTVTVRSWRNYPRMLFHAITGAAISVAWAVAAYYINVAIIPGWIPQGVGRMINTTSLMTWPRSDGRSHLPRSRRRLREGAHSRGDDPVADDDEASRGGARS